MKTDRRLSLRLVLTMMTLGFILAPGPAFAQTAAPVVAATPILKVPYIIKKPGHYLLKKNLVFNPTAGATGQAITIEADDVTLDLGGHVISCSAVQDATNTTVGIGYNSSSTLHVTIRNGVLRNFNQGITLQATSSEARVQIEDMVLSNCGTGGILAEATTLEIRHCKIVDTGYNQTINNPSFGISATSLGSTRIVDNDISNGNFSAGFLVTGIIVSPGIVERNRIRSESAQVGIKCDGESFALDNVITGFNTGIKSLSAAVKYRGNTTFGSAVPFDGGTAVGTENN